MTFAIAMNQPLTGYHLYDAVSFLSPLSLCKLSFMGSKLCPIYTCVFIFSVQWNPLVYYIYASVHQLLSPLSTQLTMSVCIIVLSLASSYYRPALDISVFCITSLPCFGASIASFFASASYEAIAWYMPLYILQAS